MDMKQQIERLIHLSFQDKKDINKLIEYDNKIDQILGIDSYQLEQSLHSKEKTEQSLYLDGLSPMALNTSYADLYNMLKHISDIRPKAKVCDLGAGHCRMAILANLFFPRLEITSVEILPERTQSIMHLLGSNNVINAPFQHVYDEILVDFYFLYFPTGSIFEEIFSCIKSYQHEFSLVTIESHGELFNRLDLESQWLKKECFFDLTYPRHNQVCYSYKKISKPKPVLEDFYERIKSFDHVIIQDSWCAETDGLEIHFDQKDKVTLEFQTPPRTHTVEVSQLHNLNFVTEDFFDEKTLSLIKKRKSQQKVYGQEIRKIYPNTNKYELSNGSIVTY